MELESLWKSSLTVPKSLKSLNSANLLSLQEKLTVAIRRQEYLITDRAFEEIVMGTRRRIKMLEDSITIFLEERVKYPDNITRFQESLTKIYAILTQRGEEKSKTRVASASRSKLTKEEKLLRKQEKNGITDEVLEQIKASGINVEEFLSSL